MNIAIQRSELDKALQQVQSAISHKITLPILSNFLIETENDQVKITGTDLELGVSVKVKANIQEPGMITIPARKFTDMIREFPESEVHIAQKKNQVIHIDCANAHFKLMGLPPEEFPKFPTLEQKWVLVTEQGLIKNMLRITSFAMSNDETRFVLNGVLVHVKGKTVEIVATDGRRLAYARRILKESTGFEKDVILPKKTVWELNKALLEEGELAVNFGETQVLFTFGNTIMLSRVLEGEFPSYDQVIPKESKEKIKMNREQFLFATKRASLLTSQESQSIKLEFFRDKVIFSKSSPEWGEVREEMPVSNEGNELSIGFNPTYLMDVLKQLSDPEIFLELTSPDKPGVIRTAEHYTYVVLPMQVI